MTSAADGPETITQESVAAWIEANWSPDLTLREWWAKLADSGLAFPTWPKGFGGRGGRAGEARVITGAMSAAEVIGPPTGNGPSMGAPTILAHGTDEQKQRFVAPVAYGTEAWAQLFSEPGAGSDLASLSTSAVLDGDEYVINGQKVWNSFADRSEWGMLLARTNIDVPKHRGITFMMIAMDQPGVEVRPLVQMNGIAEFCEVFFTDARVPVDNVIGDPGDGWNVARTTLGYERAGAGGGRARGTVSLAGGTKTGNLDRGVGELITEATQRSDQPTHRNESLLSSRAQIALARDLGLLDDPLVRDQLMRYHAENQVYTWNGRRSADNAKSGRPGPEMSILKLHIALLAHRSRDLSLSLLGAEGMLAGADARENGRYHLAAMSSPVPSLGGGTNEIQRNIIGERTLDLPREPSNDNEIPFRELRRS